MNRYEKACFVDISLHGSWQKKHKKDEVICILGVYILHMYVYFKGDEVYRVMLLLALTLQPSHISVNNESASASHCHKIYGFTTFSRLRISISAKRFLIMESYINIFPWVYVLVLVSLAYINHYTLYTYGYIRVTGIPAGTGRNG